jgi:hypothetical protein
LMAIEPRAGAGMEAKLPPREPMGVRAKETMTTSCRGEGEAEQGRRAAERVEAVPCRAAAEAKEAAHLL